MKTFLISVIRPVEVTYEVWAEDEDRAIAQVEDKPEGCYEAETFAHRPQVVEIAEIRRYYQC